MKIKYHRMIHTNIAAIEILLFNKTQCKFYLRISKTSTMNTNSEDIYTLKLCNYKNEVIEELYSSTDLEKIEKMCKKELENCKKVFEKLLDE